MVCTVVQWLNTLVLEACTTVQEQKAFVLVGCTVVQGANALVFDACTAVQGYLQNKKTARFLACSFELFVS